MPDIFLHQSGSGRKNVVRFVLKALFSLFIIALVLLGALYLFAFRPISIQEPVSVAVEPGQGASSIARELKAAGVVRSASITQMLITILGGTRSIQAGVYLFKDPENAIQIALRLVHTDLGYVPVRLTVPEGTNSHQLALLIAEKFLYSNAATSTVASIEKSARQKEGYLFPETYFFAAFTDPSVIMKKMSDTFEAKIAPEKAKIEASGKSLKEIITVASILEKEVQTKDDKRKVADIIWRRIAKGMPLQVDSTLGYVIDKTSAQMTAADLKSEDPYNTYTHKGLPPTPISNPGLESILAALDPMPNAYFFYLSDSNGITHFAKTYDEHLRNKNKYIR